MSAFILYTNSIEEFFDSDDSWFRYYFDSSRSGYIPMRLRRNKGVCAPILKNQIVLLEIGIEKPNRKTIKAMKEGDKLIEKYKKNPNSVKTYNNVDELMEAMLKW